MFKKFLAKVGIGSASIDTVLDNSTLTQGDTVTGTVNIEGGNVDQDINKVTLCVRTRAQGERKVNGEEQDYEKVVTIGKFEVSEAMKVEAGQKYSFPFSFRLPSETPITSIATGKNQSKVWIYTELDIDSGFDSGDRDYLTVMPHPAVTMMINKFLQNGFEYKKVDVEVGYLNASTFSSTSGAYQEVELRPQSGGWNWNNRTIQEVELSFIVEEDIIHLFVEIDRTYSGDGYTALSYPSTVQEDEIDAYFEKIL